MERTIKSTKFTIQVCTSDLGSDIPLGVSSTGINFHKMHSCDTTTTIEWTAEGEWMESTVNKYYLEENNAWIRITFDRPVNLYVYGHRIFNVTKIDYSELGISLKENGYDWRTFLQRDYDTYPVVRNLED